MYTSPNTSSLHYMGYFLCLIGATGSSVLPVGNIDGTLNKSHIPAKFLKKQKYKSLSSFLQKKNPKQNKAKRPNLANS